ncbi:MAG: hypothetical protein ACRC2Y_04960 [Aeromonas veronii]
MNNQTIFGDALTSTIIYTNTNTANPVKVKLNGSKGQIALIPLVELIGDVTTASLKDSRYVSKSNRHHRGQRAAAINSITGENRRVFTAIVQKGYTIETAISESSPFGRASVDAELTVDVVITDTSAVVLMRHYTGVGKFTQLNSVAEKVESIKDGEKFIARQIGDLDMVNRVKLTAIKRTKTDPMVEQLAAILKYARNNPDSEIATQLIKAGKSAERTRTVHNEKQTINGAEVEPVSVDAFERQIRDFCLEPSSQLANTTEEPSLKKMDSTEAEHTEQPTQTIKSRAQLKAEAAPKPIKRTPTGTKADPMIVDGKHVTICPELEGTIPFALSTFDSAEVDFLVTGSGRAVAARFGRPLEESTQWIATQIKSNPFFAHAVIVTKTGDHEELIDYREAVRAAARAFACEHAYLCPQKAPRAHRGTEWGKALAHEVECSQPPLMEVEERIEIGSWYEA